MSQKGRARREEVLALVMGVWVLTRHVAKGGCEEWRVGNNHES